jgi:hypothetical protein
MISHIYVGLIEWSSEDGDRDPELFAAMTEPGAERALAAFLAEDYARAPGYYLDDAEQFMADPRTWAPQDDEQPYGPLTPAAWLDGFRAATTAPYWTVSEVPVLS